MGFYFDGICLTGNRKIFIYLLEPSTNSLFYAIVGFLSLAISFRLAPLLTMSWISLLP